MRESRLLPKKRLRILYLGFNVAYVNPTKQQLIEVLSDIFDLVLFGPGYVDDEVLDRGVGAFHDAHGPFDLLFGDELSLVRPESIPEEQKDIYKFYNHACSFDPSLRHKGAEFFSFLKKYRGIRIISLLQFDYYNFSQDHESMLEEVADYFICWGPEFLLSKEEVPPQQAVNQGLNYQIYERWTDRYLDFVNRNINRILSTPHFVATSETSDKPLASRPYDWSIVGADYDSRVLARFKVDSFGLRRSGKIIPYLYSISKRINFYPYNKYWSIAFLNWIFQKAIRDAKYGFTCGSILGWPIRKYMEIPANGAVLVAEKCRGWEALGFSDGHNAIACKSEDIIDAHLWLSANPSIAQAIASAGLELIRNRHSSSARGEQIREALVRICEGQFYGTYWAEGNYVFREKRDLTGS